MEGGRKDGGKKRWRVGEMEGGREEMSQAVKEGTSYNNRKHTHTHTCYAQAQPQ